MQARRSRRELIIAAGAGALLSGCGGDAKPAREPTTGPPAPADLAILGLALTLEYFAADFYDRLVDERVLEADDQDRVKGLRDDERDHIDALESLVTRLGGRRPGRPRPDFDALLAGGPDAIIGRAAGLEDVGAAAYLGQLSRVQDEEVLAAVLSVHSVEGRHAAELNHRVGRTFVPDGALARPLASGRFLAHLSGYLL